MDDDDDNNNDDDGGSRRFWNVKCHRGQLECYFTGVARNFKISELTD